MLHLTLSEKTNEDALLHRLLSSISIIFFSVSSCTGITSFTKNNFLLLLHSIVLSFKVFGGSYTTVWLTLLSIIKELVLSLCFYPPSSLFLERMFPSLVQLVSARVLYSQISQPVCFSRISDTS